jgi:hypothetical protein
MRKSKGAPKRKSPKLSNARKNSNDYERIATSYHEASHAIVALSELMYVYQVGIIPDLEEKGEVGQANWFIMTNHEYKDPYLQKLIVMSELMAMMAGLVGERIYYKDICGSTKFPMSLKIQSADDMSKVAKLTRDNKIAEPGTAARALKKKIQQDAEVFLTDHWNDIKLIAHSLYKRKMLAFEDLKYILTRHSKNKDYWKEKFKKIKVLWNVDGELNGDLNEDTIKALLSPKI